MVPMHARKSSGRIDSSEQHPTEPWNDLARAGSVTGLCSTNLATAPVSALGRGTAGRGRILAEAGWANKSPTVQGCTAAAPTCRSNSSLIGQAGVVSSRRKATLPALASMARSLTKPQSTMFMPKSGSMMRDSAASTSPSRDCTGAAACGLRGGGSGRMQSRHGWAGSALDVVCTCCASSSRQHQAEHQLGCNTQAGWQQASSAAAHCSPPRCWRGRPGGRSWRLHSCC